MPQTFGDDKNVAEQNGGVEIEPADRLERDLGGEFRRANEFEKIVLFLELAIFRQCSSRLTHQPDGRTINGLAMTCVKKSLAVGQHWRGGFGLVGETSGHFQP